MASKPTQALELLCPREEAKAKFAGRITKGEAIQNSTQTFSPQIFNSASSEYKRWDNYNSHLLKTLFTTDELANEYIECIDMVPIALASPSESEKIQYLVSDIDEKINVIKSIIERLNLINVSATTSQGTPKKILNYNEVFVVHGHDNEAKLEVARFIEKLGFKPIILHEQVSRSKTIIEKIEAYTDVGYGVVIYTACDVGGKKTDNEKHPKNLQNRARQNVVLEHGYLIGKLGRSNVCALVKGEVETPSDITGIVYTSMDNTHWQIELANELRDAGYAVDMNKAID
ncbi:MAG: nucleotide-binding protein [Gammaproteobacteria bacterium]|nr:nucleotide-binding protein [Gammaproteobacteria bacterium]